MLLSFAGFPAAAGVDAQARVPQSQFASFKSYFSGVLRVLRCAQCVWDHDAHDVVCGFGVNHHTISGALSRQPVGTFVCYLSMPPACELIIACKVRLPAARMSPAHRRLAVWVSAASFWLHCLVGHRSALLCIGRVFCNTFTWERL